MINTKEIKSIILENSIIDNHFLNDLDAIEKNVIIKILGYYIQLIKEESINKEDIDGIKSSLLYAINLNDEYIRENRLDLDLIRENNKLKELYEAF